MSLSSCFSFLGKSIHRHLCQRQHAYETVTSQTEKERMPMNVELARKWEHYCTGGAICSEMESSTLFVLSSIHRKRAGAVNIMMAKDAHLPKDSSEMELFKGDRAIRIAVEGIKRLIEQDRADAKRNGVTGRKVPNKTPGREASPSPKKPRIS